VTTEPGPLPDPVRAFWYAACELGERVIRTPWGLVSTDSRYPIIYDANNASVLEPGQQPTLEDIRSVLHPALLEAGATQEHIEFWESTGRSPAQLELRKEGGRPQWDAVMVFEGPLAAAPASDVVVREITEPDEELWSWYSATRVEFGEANTPDVLDQLLARDRTVFHPAGLRWFIAFLDGEMGGVATLLSLESVGYVDGVVTLPAFRKRGVASATVARAVRASDDAGNRSLFLLTDDGSDAQRLYERLGFRTASTIETFSRPLPEKA
jgi:ribosomal protein S18 acetylase RimI-like enzyme